MRVRYLAVAVALLAGAALLASWVAMFIFQARLVALLGILFGVLAPSALSPLAFGGRKR